jgi:dipeptide transport system ATP-binding protein
MGLLEIENLTVEFKTGSGSFRAVDGVTLSVDKGEVLAIVGESGSGKSVSMLAVMGLLPWTARVTADKMTFEGLDLLGLSVNERRRIIGKDIAMIFQEPMSSLNPCFTVGFQIMEALNEHLDLDKAARKARAIELLGLVGIPSPEQRLKAFPHQLSGGMSQRVMVAMAIACNPRLLIADEPTTALDVTIQAQMLALLLRLQRERGMALVLITHDLGVVAEVAQRVLVMYAGQVVETARVPEIFEAPRHPYTEALLSALPEHNIGQRRLRSMGGIVPGAFDRPAGCLLSPRCPYVQPRCRAERPALDGDIGAQARCFYPLIRVPA